MKNILKGTAIVVVIVLVVLLAYYLSSPRYENYYKTTDNKIHEITEIPVSLENVKYLRLTGREMRKFNKDKKELFMLQKEEGNYEMKIPLATIYDDFVLFLDLTDNTNKNIKMWYDNPKSILPKA
jgi:hypothetical protein